MDVTGVNMMTNNINAGSMAQIKVMKQAEGVMEDVMGKLLESMDAMITGLGQNVDSSV